MGLNYKSIPVQKLGSLVKDSLNIEYSEATTSGGQPMGEGGKRTDLYDVPG